MFPQLKINYPLLLTLLIVLSLLPVLISLDLGYGVTFAAGGLTTLGLFGTYVFDRFYQRVV